MKILVLYQSPWWNAAAYYAYNLTLSLTRLGHKVIFVSKNGTPVANKILLKNYSLFDINLFENNPLNFYSNINKVKQIIFEQQIDCLIPVSAPGHIICGIIKKMYKPEIPIVKICLDNMSPTNNILNKYLHNHLTDYFIFPGESTRKNYKKFRLKDSMLLHAPIDAKDFSDFKPDLDLKDYYKINGDKTVISFVGRFSPEKGIFFLLQIIDSVLKKTDKAFFVLSGSEEQIKFADVQEKIDELGISKHIKIINKVDDVRKILSITDIGLLSSRFSEYICRIAMEFMSSGIPVVAPDVNVIPEVVGDNSHGFIYSLNDFNQAADFLVRLINDKPLLNSMGENSRERIFRIYDNPVFDRQIKSVLEKVR